MKLLRTVLVWVLISLALQSIVYIYLDRAYFGDAKNIKLTKFGNSSEDTITKINVNFPEGANKISLSYDDKFVAYFDKANNFYIYDSKTIKQCTVPFENNSKCLAYKWLPDSNIIMLAEKVIVSNSIYVRFSSFDVEKAYYKIIGDPKKNDKAVLIKGINTEVDIQVSVMTGVLYEKITDNSISKIYRIDRNEKLTTVGVYGSKIGNFSVASHDDLIAYDDLANNQVRTTYESKIFRINGKTNFKLLGADGGNYFYIGDMTNGVVSNIYYGKLSDTFSAWQKIAFDTATKPENIWINYNGDIYLKTLPTSILNIKTKKLTPYIGEFIEVSNEKVICLDKGKLVFK